MSSKREKRKVEIGKLADDTHWTEKEVKEFYKICKDGTSISREKFEGFLKERGEKKKKGKEEDEEEGNGILLPSGGLKDRLWDVFDKNNDDEVSMRELLTTLSKLLRGNVQELSDVFFDLYDVNHDQKLSVDEISSVYYEILKSTMPEGTKLGDNEMNRIKRLVKEADVNDDGELDKEEFTAAVQKALKMGKEGKDAFGDKKSGAGNKSIFARCGTIGFIILMVFLTSWFEVGTSFAIPAPGALSDGFKARFTVGGEPIGDAQIGLLTGFYFASAMIGPLIGGQFMDRIGPGIVIIAANIIVTLGACLQAIEGPFWLLVIARLLIGLGGEVTPFTTIEILARLFPNYVMLAAGWRNLVQSGSGFLAFLILPWINESFGIDQALWFIALLGAISLLTNLIVLAIMKTMSKKEAGEKGPSPAAALRATAKAVAPKNPSKLSHFLLPVSFYLSILGIKAVYFPPFSFTAFSIKIYEERFAVTKSMAGFFSGLISMIAGLSGPIFGPVSDFIGHRALSLGISMVPSVVGFALLGIFDFSWMPWVATVLFAITYGFGDTVAYISIRLLVGEHRAGLGYGMYGIFGNLLAVIVPSVGGYLLENVSDVAVLFYFSGLMLAGTLAWFGVRLLEGSKSQLETRAKDMIQDPSDEALEAASLFSHIGAELPEPEG